MWLASLPLILLSAALIVDKSSPKSELTSKKRKAEAQVVSWINKNTPKDTVFFIAEAIYDYPVRPPTFFARKPAIEPYFIQYYAGRAIFSNNDFPFSEAHFKEFALRRFATSFLNDVGRPEEFYCLSKLYDLDYLITADIYSKLPNYKKKRYLKPGVENSELYSDYNPVYENSKYKIYEIKTFEHNESCDSLGWLKKAIENNTVERVVMGSEYKNKLIVAAQNMVSPIERDDFCHTSEFQLNLWDNQRCLVGEIGGQKKQLIYGMGKAENAHSLGFFMKLAKNTGVELRNFFHEKCDPFFYEGINKENTDACKDFNEDVLNRLEPYDVIIIHPPYELLLPGRQEEFLIALERLNRFGQKIIVSLPPVKLKSFNPRCTTRYLRTPQVNKNNSTCKILHDIDGGGDLALYKTAEKLGERFSNIDIFNISNFTCEENICTGFNETHSLYYNDDYLSIRGGTEIADKNFSN